MTIENEGPPPDEGPPSEPSGGLAPPVRHPPTAVGARTPSPELRRPSIPLAELRVPPELLAFIASAVTSTLDMLDAAGDAVAERLGIR